MISAREEACDWLESAVVDLEDARDLYTRGRYHLALFLSHQAVEKALKAYLIGVKRVRPPKTHDLVELLSIAGLQVDSSDAETIAELSPYYTISRYPNAGLRKPWREIPRSVAQKYVAVAERVVSKVLEVLEQCFARVQVKPA